MVRRAGISVCELPGEPCMVIELHACPFSCLSCRRRREAHPVGKPKVLVSAASIWGCEPLLNPECLPALRELRGMGMRVKLHTSGYAPDALEEVLAEKLVDVVEVHVRAPLDSRYAEMTGREDALERLFESMWVLASAGTPAFLRIWLLPPLFVERQAREVVHAFESTGVRVEGVALSC